MYLSGGLVAALEEVWFSSGNAGSGGGGIYITSTSTSVALKGYSFTGTTGTDFYIAGGEASFASNCPASHLRNFGSGIPLSCVNCPEIYPASARTVDCITWSAGVRVSTQQEFNLALMHNRTFTLAADINLVDTAIYIYGTLVQAHDRGMHDLVVDGQGAFFVSPPSS